jgi:hypothetical protein
MIAKYIIFKYVIIFALVKKNTYDIFKVENGRFGTDYGRLDHY